MNKYTRSINSTLLKNKVSALSKVLKESLANKDYSTLEKQMAEASNLLSSLYREIGTSTFNPNEVLPGSVPNVKDYNGNINKLKDDLEILFAELENVEGLVLQNFNYFVSESNRLNRKVKSVASKLGDYILFAGNILKDSLYFSDSFSNLNSIETDPAFLKGDQCEINQAEGIITLPVNRTSQSSIKISKTPIINSNSNGVAGNSQEVGAALNDNILSILDSNPDTWFEYEKVVTSDDGVPLVLDIRLDLGSEQVTNFIRINPNNFGTNSQIEILDISTSQDGAAFISIKDEILVPGFVTIDEPNVFNLAPSTSKYAGQGLYTFTPRLAKYVHIVLRQTTPYVINTLTGSKLRYAIGIRDIEVEALQYKEKGEIVSKEYISSDEIRKILLLSSQSPAQESELVSITHQISPDNGDSWIDIRPKDFSGLTDVVNSVQEVITFNTGLDGSVETDSPVSRVRYKAILERKPTAFKEGSASLRQNSKPTTELHQLPATTPFSINLDKSPVPETVQLVDPHFGSRGLDNFRYTVAIGNESAQNYLLPWRTLALDKTKTRNISTDPWLLTEANSAKVYVNGELWNSANLTTSNANSKVYNIDYNKGILKFGDGTKGRAPEQGSIISLGFTPERLLTVPSEKGHKAKLAFPTNGDKKSVVIKRYGSLKEQTEPLDKFSKVFRLSQKNIVPETAGGQTVTFKPTGSPFATWKEFKDGKVELTATGQYSIDYESGIIYTFDTTGSVSEVSVSYKYLPETTLEEGDWDFSDTDALKDEILIKNSGWATIPVQDELIPTGVKKLHLEHFNIEPGTLSLSNTTVFAKEVPFKDGRTEVLGLLRASEVVPAGVLDQGSFPAVKTFNTSLIPADITNHLVSFSNTAVFINQVPGTPTLLGEYQIVTATRTVNVYMTAAAKNPGSMTYHYQDPTKSLLGNYSVDYKNGTVYCFTTTTSATTAKYQYSHLEASYPIARVVPTEDYEVDPSTKTILVSDREILRKIQIPGVPARTAGNTYQVLYNYVHESRSGIEQLEPYFTPILKEYVLKVLPKSKLF